MGNLIFWRKDVDQSLQEAPSEGKPVFLHFFNPG